MPSSGMRLVIESELLQQVTLSVGPVELPLTREQVVSILFGEEYVVTKTNGNGHSHPALTNGHTVRRGRRALPEGVKGLLPPHVEPRRRKVSGGIDHHVFDFLKHRDPQSVAEIREMLEEKVPGIGGNHRQSYFAGMMNRLQQQGRLVRHGSPGSFKYSLGSIDAVIENVPQEKTDDEKREQDARRKRNERRVKQGLCMRCDKKHLKDKKLCREHYDIIMKAQKVMVKRRNDARKAREAVN